MPRKDQTTSIAEQIVASSNEKEEIPGLLQLVPSGSTLLNLACSDSRKGAFGYGKVVNLIGDSSSGKTFVALTTMAEMAQRKRFKDHRLIFDDVEAANEFNLSNLFGDKMASRIETPGGTTPEGEEVMSDTIEDFQDNIETALEKGDPFIYILDSLDALDAKDDAKKANEMRKARKEGKETAGSYGMAKPKKMSELFRRIVRKLKRTNSLLIVISQTRDNINPMSFEKKTRSGGRALKFYSSLEMWMAVEKKLLKKERIIGVQAKVKISKNKQTGKVREISFPIFYDYGLDDLGSCIDFLVNEKIWEVKGNTIQARDLKLAGTRDKLIKTIESDGLENELRGIVEEKWLEIEETLKLHRKRKYA